MHTCYGRPDAAPCVCAALRSVDATELATSDEGNRYGDTASVSEVTASDTAADAEASGGSVRSHGHARPTQKLRIDTTTK